MASLISLIAIEMAMISSVNVPGLHHSVLHSSEGNTCAVALAFRQVSLSVVCMMRTTYTPPNKIGDGLHIFVLAVLHQEAEVGKYGKDDNLEVEDNHKLFTLVVEHREEEPPWTKLSLDSHHLYHLEEAVKASKSPKRKHLVAFVCPN